MRKRKNKTFPKKTDWWLSRMQQMVPRTQAILRRTLFSWVTDVPNKYARPLNCTSWCGLARASEAHRSLIYLHAKRKVEEKITMCLSAQKIYLQLKVYSIYSSITTLGCLKPREILRKYSKYTISHVISIHILILYVIRILYSTYTLHAHTYTKQYMRIRIDTDKSVIKSLLRIN